MSAQQNLSQTAQPKPLVQRLLWFVALWLLGTGTVTAVAYILRLWIAPHR